MLHQFIHSDWFFQFFNKQSAYTFGKFKSHFFIITLDPDCGSHLTLVDALRLDLYGIDNPSEEGDDCYDKGAGQREEQQEQQDATIGRDLNVLQNDVPWRNLKNEC